MNVNIKDIKYRGDLHEERLILEVSMDDDIGRYVVFDTAAAEDGGVSNRVKRAYWFPDKAVSAGDLVVLYTRAGQPKIKRNSGDFTTHFFYWGLDQPVWDRPGKLAVLLKTQDWQAKNPVDWSRIQAGG